MTYRFHIARLLTIGFIVASGLFGQYTVTSIPTLGGSGPNAYVLAKALNDVGQVVGTASIAANTASHAFLYSNGLMTDLGTLGGSPAKAGDVVSVASGINNGGEVVGSSLVAGNLSNPVWHAFRYKNGVMTDLGTLGGTNTYAVAINNVGQVVGTSSLASDSTSHAFLYSNGVMQDLGSNLYPVGINDAGQIIGTLDLPTLARHAFLYTNGVTIDLGTLGGQNSTPTGINNTGQVCGEADLPPGKNLLHHAFLYRNGVMADLGDLGGGISTATGLNSGEEVVGVAWVTLNPLVQQPLFVYRNGTLTNINPLIPTDVRSQFLTPVAINKAGQILVKSAVAYPILLTPSAAPPPSIDSGGIVPISSSATNISPGSWVSIFGQGLAPGTAYWNGDFPTLLSGVTVMIDGKRAYLSFVSPTQINLQVPDSSATGTVSVVLTSATGTVRTTTSLAHFSPSFNLLDGKYLAGVIPTPDGSGAYGGGTYDLAGPAGRFAFPTRAVKQGEVVELYGTGFGLTIPMVLAGTPFSGAAPAATPVEITIGGVRSEVQFAGITAAGSFQFNVIVPNTASGDQLVQGRVGGIGTLYALLTVQ